MSIRYDGKVAIVTGAGHGLGRCHALALAQRGAKVVVNDLGGSKDGTGASSEAARAVVAEIEAAGGEAIANGANVAKYAEVEAMVQQAMDQWGRVDILINNAGILRDKSFTKGSLEDFQLVVDVHLMGTVNCTKAVWEIMREQAYGRIVVTTSSSGLYGNFGQSNYGAAKMGVIGLMNTLVQEGAKYNIRVNALCPGPLKTKLLMDFLDTEEKQQRRLVHVPMGRFGDAEEMAKAALFLATEDSSYMTGATFTVDGGLTAAYVTPE
jgi:NAD(P)-dependent dehydrogenase (short-subunit alcohol dehydrogenase family)